VAGGVSLGAAISYAHLLGPERAAAASGAAGDGLDHYGPEIGVSIRSKRLKRVLNRRELSVRVTSNDSASFTLSVQIRDGGKVKTIGTKRISFTAPTDSALDIPLKRAGRRILADRQHSWVRVVATAEHQQTQGTFATSAIATKVLKS
jgi:hypothetical protein